MCSYNGYTSVVHECWNNFGMKLLLYFVEHRYQLAICESCFIVWCYAQMLQHDSYHPLEQLVLSHIGYWLGRPCLQDREPCLQD